MKKTERIVGDVVIDLLRKYPSQSSKHLAEILMSELPGHYQSLDSARCAVRYYRGAKGVHSRACMDPEGLVERISIPEADVETYEPYILGPDAYPVVAGGDAHVPFHDRDALEIFIERAVKIGAKTVVLAGDWLDFYGISSFLRDPRKRNIVEEIELFKEILGIIAKALPNSKIIYKLGNHEERYDAYILRNAPELYRLDAVHLHNVLGLAAMGIECVSEKRIVKAGHLNIIHGHEYRFAISNPVSPARGLFLKAGANAICWHFHKKSEHSTRNMNGKRTGTWSAGCLCGLTPQYAPLNDWGHGFAEIYQDDDYFKVDNKGIINYRIV